MSKRKVFPSMPREYSGLIAELTEKKANDLDWKAGRSFSYVYYADDAILDVLKEAYTLYFSENALNPAAFPSLRNMEIEVVQMCLDLFNGGAEAAGSMTSGGTESILMAVKSAKAYMKEQNPHISNPNIILPITAHPAFNKACDYFDVEPIILPVQSDYRIDPVKVDAAINEQTIMIVGSAPQYPQGVVDPIEELGQVALKHKVCFHVDACVGGFLLPFMKEKKRFDLAVPGVTSLSADIHKYGYASKGSSVILYNKLELRKAQYYVYTGWPGGMYGSPSISGTRPGGAIAVAWTVLQAFGRSRYEELVDNKMKLVERFKQIIESYPELSIVGEPETCIFSFESDQIDIYELGDEMYVRGWLMDRQQLPASLHISISPNHAHYIDEFEADFKQAMERVRGKSLTSLGTKAQVLAAKGLRKVLPKSTFDQLQQKLIERSDPDDKRSAALYGMIGDLRGTGDLDQLIRDYLDKMMR